MKKSVLTLLLLSLGATATFAQVGVNTQNPQAVFHVDGAKDNVTTGIPTAAQQSNDVVITSQGRLGVGTNTPTNNLEVNSEIAGTSGIKITQLPKANTLSTDANGNIIAQDIKTAGVNVTKQRLVIANSSNVINSGSGDYSFRYSSNAAGGYWQMRINNGTSRQFNTWDVEFYGNNANGQVWQGRNLQTINPNTWTNVSPSNPAGGTNEYNTMHIYDLGTGAIIRFTTTLISINSTIYESMIAEEF